MTISIRHLLTLDDILFMSFVGELQTFWLNIGYLGQLCSLNDFPPVNLWLLGHLYHLQMVSELVCPRKSPTIPPKHVNLYVSLPVHDRSTSLPWPKASSKHSPSDSTHLCPLVTPRETTVLEMGEFTSSKCRIYGHWHTRRSN
jgi:hypothetical protein